MQCNSIQTTKRKGEVISVLPSQEILPATFSNETTVLSCSIFVLKTILCKILIAQAKMGISMGILREIFQWKRNSFGIYNCWYVLTFFSINCHLCTKRFQAFHWGTDNIFFWLSWKVHIFLYPPGDFWCEMVAFYCPVFFR